MKHRTAYLLWMLFLLIALGLGLWLSIESWQGKLPDPVRGLDEPRLRAAISRCRDNLA